MSSLVVPPTSGLNTELASPKMPWQLAHFVSHRSCPCATLPEPAGRPLKSGRTSMSHAATSFGVALRPMPGNLSCANAALHSAATAHAASASTHLDIAHLAALFHQPRLDRVVVIARARAAHAAQLPVIGLHVSRVVARAAQDDRGLAVPHPFEREAREALAHHRLLQPRRLP